MKKLILRWHKEMEAQLDVPGCNEQQIRDRYWQQVKSVGGDRIYADSMKELEYELVNAFKRLGGEIFPDPELEGSGSFGYIIVYPQEAKNV